MLTVYVCEWDKSRSFQVFQIDNTWDWDKLIKFGTPLPTERVPGWLNFVPSSMHIDCLSHSSGLRLRGSPY